MSQLLQEQRQQRKILQIIASDMRKRTEQIPNHFKADTYYSSSNLFDLLLEYGSVFILGLIVGGMLSHLGTELWGWILA